MGSELTKANKESSVSDSLSGTLLAGWRWWISGAVLSFFLASVLMSGWPTGLLPNLAYPYTYGEGDSLSAFWNVQRIIEGWVFDNPRTGFPFGSNSLDYPNSDSGTFLFLKLLSMGSISYYKVFNLFFLLSFPATFIAAFGVFNAIGLSRIFAFCAALLFVFLPFPFLRLHLGHIALFWYFVVPLFFYAGFRIFFNQDHGVLRCRKPLALLGLFAGFIILASFGPYYALFGVIVLGVAVLAAWVRSGNVRFALPGLFAIAAVIIGVLLNAAPSLIHKTVHSANPEAVIRSPGETERYGFKMMQLILPRVGHREPHLRGLTDSYNRTRPLINENVAAALGMVGACGFLLSGIFLFVRFFEGRVDERLVLLGVFIFILFLFGTIGGLGSLFASVISPAIRAWNRISVFISFAALATFFLALQRVIGSFCAGRKFKVVLIVLAVPIGLFGLYDQTVPASKEHNARTQEAFELDRNFVARIESIVSTGSAIYQLPYMPFPEVSPLQQLETYDLMAGFLHSRSLRWSYGGMKGREGDLFYKVLAQGPIEKQLEVIKRLGFAGVYIDRRGFKKADADRIIGKLSHLLASRPALVHGSGEIVFFKIDPAVDVDLQGLTPTQIIQRAGYTIDELGRVRHAATLENGIDFTRYSWPTFVRNVAGLSRAEPWGRWSDASKAPFVRFEFYHELPKKFTLVLSALPFGPNTDQDLIVRLGSQEHRLKMAAGISEMRLPIELGEDSVDFIEFIPPKPTSPHELGVGTDGRRLGVGFVRLRFEE